MFGKLIYLWPLLVLSASGSVCHGEECSKKNARIAGGEITEQNSRPFQVALYSRVGTTGELGFCGGSLVSQEWVLTAAHCCFHDGEEVNHVQAILGAHSLYDRYEHGRRVVNVAKLVVHPEYNPETFANDIALVRLANIVQLTATLLRPSFGYIAGYNTLTFIAEHGSPNDYAVIVDITIITTREMINTIQLPYRSISSFNFAGVGAVVSGWGIAAEGVTFVSPTLRQKLMTVITDPLCNISYFNQLPENTMCAFYGTSGTCKGDNGGPMTIFYNATEEDILVGVTSFVSSSGCNDNQPSVFTRVQRYLDWISQVTGVPLT